MRRIMYILIVFFFGFSAVIIGQETTAVSASKLPYLNGHTFLTTSFVGSAFINTSLQADLGVGGTASAKIPGIKIGDYEFFAYEGSLLFFDMRLQYQQKFTPWLSLFTTFKTIGRVGTQMTTIMADGLNTLIGGDIGWLVRLKHTDKLYLSGVFGLSNYTGNIINVSQYFEEITEDNPNPTLSKKSYATGINAGIRGAYAFNPSFGLQFQSDVIYGESFERQKTSAYFLLAVLGDYDLKAKSDIPMGLGLGYTISSSPGIVMSDGGVSHVFLGKVGYTGSDDFELGIQFTKYNVNVTTVELDHFINKLTLNLKFYF